MTKMGCDHNYVAQPAVRSGEKLIAPIRCTKCGDISLAYYPIEKLKLVARLYGLKDGRLAS